MAMADQFVNQWLRHRTVLIDVLNRVGDEHTDFRAWPEGMTLSGLALHMAMSGKMFADAVKTGAFTRPDGINVTTMPETRKVVEDCTEETKDILASLSDEEIERIVPTKAVFGVDLPGKAMLHAMREHEVHHKGQMFVYARMVGVKEMPMFINSRL